MRPRFKVFYGWWIVVANMIILSVEFGVGFFSFGIFFKPLATEFGWGRAAVAGAMSIFSLLWGLSAPLGGRLTDRFGSRKVMLFSAIPFGAIFLLLARVQTLWHLYLFYALLAFTYGGLSMVQASSLVNRWFPGQKGIAMGITFSGVSLGGMVFAPVVAYLVNIMGWRDTYLALGIGSWIVMLPLILWLIKDSPGPSPAGGPMARETSSRAGSGSKVEMQAISNGIVPVNMPPRSWTAYQMMHSSAFWGISVAFLLANLGQIAVITHQVPFLTDRGISPLVAASALGFTSGVGILGKLLSGYAADRWSKRYIAVLSFLLQAVGLFILMQAWSLPLVWAFVFIFGMSMGGTAITRPLMVSEYFGEASFGAIYGWIELTRLLGGTMGPFIAGWVYDVTQSYTWAFIPFIVCFLIGILPIMLIKPAKQ